MKSKATVFSLVREQSVFLTVLMSVLSFLAVLCLGLTISIGTSVSRWGGSFEKMATVQIMPGGSMGAVQNILDENKNKIVSSTHISDDEVARMLKPWLGNSAVLKDYVPKMMEVKFKSKSDVNAVGDKLRELTNVRFLTHADGVRNTVRAGWQIMIIAIFVMLLAFGAIGACVIYITRNIALVHKKELEIMNLVGANDKFVSRQLERVIGKISIMASAIGFGVAALFLLFINHMANKTRVGLMAGMDISGAGWCVLLGMGIGLVVLSVYIARKTTYRVLEGRIK